MSSGDPPRLTPLRMTAAPGEPQPRHETVLPAPPAEALAYLGRAVERPGPGSSLRAVVTRWPTFLDGWAHLGRSAWDEGDPVAAYAFARTGYHRGLDAMRRAGWGGTGLVRWEHESNHGFLRSLHLLLVAAARMGELDEAVRCREFLLDLDPDDGIEARFIPEEPGTDWAPERFP